jgi:two-component system, OmpR family, phosphate regulon response regulator OmpR
MQDAAHLLVVDDDERLRSLLQRYLTGEGYRVTTARDAAEARTKLASVAFDLIVLDLMMPGETGLDFTRAWRRDSALPILMLTAMGEVDDRISGLESGADDYLAKPFEPKELLLRIRTILKRASPSRPQRQVAFGDCLFDSERQLLVRAGKNVRLTQAETALLAAFAARPGTILSREELARLLGLAQGQGRTIDVQVTRLRRKIEEDPRFPRYLQTVRGKGYVLQPD